MTYEDLEAYNQHLQHEVEHLKAQLEDYRPPELEELKRLRNMEKCCSVYYDDLIRWEACTTFEERNLDRLRRLERGDCTYTVFNTHKAFKIFCQKTGYVTPKNKTLAAKIEVNKAKIPEVKRLILEGFSNKSIGRQTGMATSSNSGLTIRSIRQQMIEAGELTPEGRPKV